MSSGCVQKSNISVPIIHTCNYIHVQRKGQPLYKILHIRINKLNAEAVCEKLHCFYRTSDWKKQTGVAVLDVDGLECSSVCEHNFKWIYTWCQ